MFVGSEVGSSFMKYSRRIWDSVAHDYDVIWAVPDYTPILRGMIQDAGIELGMDILDVATGTGMVCIEVARTVGENGLVLGIDYSRPMLKQAAAKAMASGLRNVSFVLADAHNLPVSDNRFDAVTSCFAFAFFSSPQEAGIEMVRAVRTQGKVASVEWDVPPLDFWAEQRRRAGIHDFPESELVRILYDSGLRRIRAKRIQVLHRRPDASDELVGNSQLLSAAIMGLREKDAKGFFSRMREEYRKLLPEKKQGWLPILYVGTKY
jgi:ubiquinone/menaquinone biosynthesis C-methylase UbiE